MFLYNEVQKREADQQRVKVGLIGAGKFGSMFLSQIPSSVGLEVSSIVDISIENAKKNCRDVGWTEERIASVLFFDDLKKMVSETKIDVLVEATGDPIEGTKHALTAIEEGLDIVMVNVEADVLCGPYLAKRAEKAGVVYSMAYGDQPALTTELVEWARASGFNVVAAGKGTKYLPQYHYSTPDTVWDYYGLNREEACSAGMNSRMFNSFLDGTKSALEMAAISNSTLLKPPPNGLQFPPAGIDHLSHILRPRHDGGTLDFSGTVEVVSSLERDGRPVFKDLRWGVYVVLEAGNEYAAKCFKQYGMNTDDTGRFSSMYKPFHLIGMELNTSIFSAAILKKATGHTKEFFGDVIATAKQNLKRGQILDGEGGFTVWGRLYPAEVAKKTNGLPIGLANNVKLKNDIGKDQPVCWSDVEPDMGCPVVQIREKMQLG